MKHRRSRDRYIPLCGFSLGEQLVCGGEMHFFGSVITHYDTFIHTGCKGPWALPRGSPRVMRSLRRPLLNCPKTVCIVFCCSARIAAVLRNTTHPGGSENQIFHCNRNSPNKGNELFLSQAFHALLLRTYVPANGIYSTCRHSSGMSSGTYVHGESP